MHCHLTFSSLEECEVALRISPNNLFGRQAAAVVSIVQILGDVKVQVLIPHFALPEYRFVATFYFL